MGNTPTCVGKTLTGGLLMASVMETPPPAWGRRYQLQSNHLLHGNTPTCVGKTWEVTRHLQWLRKHPHLRGEDRRCTRPKQADWETPPPAWGRPSLTTASTFVVGNTPTCVGKTNPLSLRTVINQKHPHLRGEDPLSTG